MSAVHEEFVMPQIDRSTPVLLVRTGRPRWDYGALATIRSLGRLGVPVFALGDEAELHRSSYLTGFVGPPLSPASTPTDAVAVLNGAAGAIGSPAVVMAGDDESAILLSEQRMRLDPRLLLLQGPAGLARHLSDKTTLAEVAAHHGIGHPASLRTSSMTDAVEFAQEVGFPLVLKSPEPYQRLHDRAVPVTRRVCAPEELHEVVAEVRPGAALFLQKYVHGPGVQTWYAAGLASEDPDRTFVATGRKLAAYPRDTGVGVLSVSEEHPRLAGLMTRLVRRLAYRGPFDSDWVHDRITGELRLIDFNPRRGAQFRLFQDTNGLDIVRATHLELTGQPWTWSGQMYGRFHEVENLSRFRGARLCWQAPGRLERSWWAKDDPGPAGVVAAQMLGAARRKAAKRLTKV